MKFVYPVRLTLSIIVFIFAILGITGIFYPLPIFDLQFAPLLQRVLCDFSVIAISLLAILTVLTLFFGRIYCSLICPLGILQELIALITRKEGEYIPSFPLKYFIMAITIGTMIGSSALIIRYLEPYTFFSSAMTLSIVGIIAVITIILLVIFKNRIFCTNICPVGTLLGLISKISLFKIYIDKNECLSCSMCERNCPAGAINSAEQTVNNETCIKCLKCLNTCYKDAIKYGCKGKEKTEFSQKRRQLLISSAVLLTFAGAVKLGVEISKNAARKLKNIILPPASVSESRLLNKCLNCNLCVSACPEKIIKKADKNFNAVHIDYSNGYCKYDCNECSKVCPSGAIKKISLEEKQKTRIALAVINQENCNNCGVCALKCPTNAITIKDGKTSIDASLCIGCGKCKTGCGFNAIKIFAVNEQKII